MKECPHCGGGSYYQKYQVSGPSRAYSNFDGTEAENGEMYEGLTYRGGKYAYCAGCHKRLFRVSK
ncbi:hypothetical protein [Paenibacillus aceti]|nr:hypothetical protein [Paenibacillus aceti]